MKICLLLILVGFDLLAGGWRERDYSADLARRLGGDVELAVRGDTGAVEGFCDVVTDSLAVEVEFASKWKEAPSQALLYARCLGKTPAIGLIWEPHEDSRYLRRLLAVLKDVRPSVVVILIEKRKR